MREKPPRFAGGFTAEAVTLSDNQTTAKLLLTCLILKTGDIAWRKKI